MTKCIKHIIENSDVQEALENGDQNEYRGGYATDVSFDGEGDFTLRGIECKRCHDHVDIYFSQNEEDKKYVQISDDAADEIHWEDPIGSVCIEAQTDAYKSFEIKEMVEQSRYIHKCQICGININTYTEIGRENIQQHIMEKHSETDV